MFNLDSRRIFPEIIFYLNLSTDVSWKRLEKRTKPHQASIAQDYDKIQEFALTQKKSDAISNWINEKSEKTFIIIIDEDLKKCNFEYDWK